MSEEEFDKKNRKMFRVYMSEVDFTKIIISIPNWAKLPPNIIKNEHLMKNVRPSFLNILQEAGLLSE